MSDDVYVVFSTRHSTVSLSLCLSLKKKSVESFSKLFQQPVVERGVVLVVVDESGLE